MPKARLARKLVGWAPPTRSSDTGSLGDAHPRHYPRAMFKKGVSLIEVDIGDGPPVERQQSVEDQTEVFRCE